MSAADLRDCLAALPEVDLLGMRLLRASPQPAFFPTDVSRQTLTEAIREIVAYTESAFAAANRLRDLAPIPLTIPIPEFGL